MKHCALFYCALALLLAAAPAPGQSEDETRKAELEKVAEKIRRQKTKLTDVEKKEARVIATLNTIEKQLAQHRGRYDEVNGSIHTLQNEIDVARRRAEELTASARAMEQYLYLRLTALYKYFRRSGLRIALSSSSYNEFLYQERTLADIVARDYRQFADYSEQLRTAALHRESLVHKRESLEQTREALKRARDEITSAQFEKTVFLNRLKKEKILQRNALQELEEYSRELQSLVEKLPGAKKSFSAGGVPFTRMKGKLAFPVNGKVISTFGRKEHPELNTFTFQKGIEIKAARGSEIKAIHDGRVIFADWFKGYGHMIIIDHGESYYSLSAHASKLLKNTDDVVMAGESIALVGDTNSIKGDCLYFEIRHHGKPQNPLTWLKR